MATFLTREQMAAAGENIQLALPLVQQLLALEYAHALKVERDPDAEIKASAEGNGEPQFHLPIGRCVEAALDTVMCLKHLSIDRVRAQAQAAAPASKIIQGG